MSTINFRYIFVPEIAQLNVNYDGIYDGVNCVHTQDSFLS